MHDKYPLKTLVHGFETADCSGAMLMLQSKGLIDIRVWIGDSATCSINIFDLFNARIPVSNPQLPQELYMKLYEKIYLFEAIFARHHVLDGVISISTRLNIFNILVKYLYNLVVNNDIELMIFSNIPHEGPDYLLFLIAQYMNIDTIICTQSLFPNMFFIFTTIDDFGVFDTSSDINDTTIQGTTDCLKTFEGPLFYMKGATPISLGKRISMFQPLDTLALIRKVIRRPRCDRQSVSRLFSTLKKYSAAYDFYNYTSHLRKLISADIDLAANYIYFPLHLQPELTTVPLGFEYFDQALALEELHLLLPPGWKIYVKENPKQTEFMRDPFFFKRVEVLKNLVWVPRDYDSHTLIKSCKILATVTGTAGWEALLQKKPVVVFGSAWYKNFPYVFTYSRSMDLFSVANSFTDMNDIFEHLSVLQKKMGTGVVDPAYSVLVENYSVDGNCLQLYESLHLYMDKM